MLYFSMRRFARTAAALSLLPLFILASSAVGETWGWSATAPLPGAADVFRLIPTLDGSLFAATGPEGAIFRSDDGGGTWIRSVQLPGARQVYAILQVPDGAVYAGTLPGGSIFVTRDGGGSWDLVASLPGATEVKSLALDNDGVLYAGTGPRGRVYASLDGATWSETSPLGGASFVYCLLAASDGAVYAGTDRGVFRTGDGGAQWESTGGPAGVPVVFRLCESSDGSIYAGCDGSVFFTTDRGGSWIPTGRLGPFAYAVFSVVEGADGTIYAGTGSDGGVYGLFDGDWRSIARFAGYRDVYDLLPLPDGTAFAAAGDSAAGGGVLVYAPLLSLDPDVTELRRGEPLRVEASVAAEAGAFDAWAVLAGPAGVFSFDLSDPSVLLAGLRPLARGVHGLAAPIRFPLLDLGAVPPDAPPGEYTLSAGLSRPGAPPSEADAIPGYFDSRRITVLPE